MRKDHRPYWLKHIQSTANQWYVRHFLTKNFDAIGTMPHVLGAKSVQVHGANIKAGDHLHIISSKEHPVKITTWSGKNLNGKISIGHYCLISPGTNIVSAQSIIIADNCMIAADCYITDCDWHGIYNRIRPFRCSAPTQLHENVWLGHGVKVGKGVTIGENSVVAAGSVVVKDVPANVIVGGNPAKVIKDIDPKRKMLKREMLFADGQHYFENQDKLDKFLLQGNSFREWLRSKILPNKHD